MDKKVILNDIYRYYSPNNNFKINKRKNLQKKIKNKDKIFEKTILSDISNIFNNYVVIDWTEKNSCCYEYKILLHENQPILDDDIELIKFLNGIRYDLWIFVSILAKYYYITAEETKYFEEDKWIFNNISIEDDKIKKLLTKIDSYFFNKGYLKLSDEEIKIPVPFIETELKDYDNVTVFDCLFTDYC